MDDLVEFHLETFSLTSRELGSSLSVTSIGFISNLPTHLPGKEADIYQLVQSGDLWLLSPGFSQFEVTVLVNGGHMSEIGPETGFLEDIAEAICQCLVWKRLGLVVVLDDIHYEPSGNGSPNLYFNIQHPDKSSALLSPPYALTAHLKGLQSIFHFQTEGTGEEELVTSRYRYSSPHAVNNEVPTKKHGFVQCCIHSEEPNGDAYDVGPNNDVKGDIWSADEGAIRWDPDKLYVNEIDDQVLCDLAARLVDAALYILLGIPRQRKGLRLIKLDNVPSLIQLAPGVWNAHYLKAMNKHVRSIPIISDVLARLVTKAQTPSLRRKAGDLMEKHHPQETSENSHYSQQPVQNRLWRLLHDRLKRGVGTEKCPRINTSSEPVGIESIETDLPAPCLHGTADDTSFGGIDNGLPQSDLGSLFTSDWPLSCPLVDEYPEDMLTECPLDVSFCHDNIELHDEAELRDLHVSAWDIDVDLPWRDIELDGQEVPNPHVDAWAMDDMQWRDVEFNDDQEDALDEGCNGLPLYYSGDQPTQRQPAAGFDHSTLDTIYIDDVDIEDYQQPQNAIEWHSVMDEAMDVEFPTSETIGSEDYGFHPPCGFDCSELDMYLEDDIGDNDV